MKLMRTFFLSLILITASSLNAQYQLDTVSVKTVSSGVKHYHLVESSKPWNIHIAEVDLNDEYLTIETAHADDRYSGHATTSSQAVSNTYEGHEVVVAINGDFFDGDGVTTGHQVINGELLRSIQARNWSKIAFDFEGFPSIERFNYSGTAIITGQSTGLDGVNVVRAADNLVLYNSYLGLSTNQNEWGTEVLLEPLNDWLINDTVICKVKKVEERVGNMAIEDNHVVLSAHGTKEPLLTSLNAGDTVSLIVKLTPGEKRITQLISGFPQIVKDGANYALDGYYAEGGGASFATDYHPRTGIGFSQDSTKLYLFVVDGRQSISRGVSLIELADLMIQSGVYTGLNLDGGGSSAMVVKGKVVNSPSDPNERAVANTLHIVSSEPVRINELRLYPDTVVTNLERPVQFWFDAIDLYGYEHNYAFDEASFSMTDNSIGTISSTGLFEPMLTGFSEITASIDDGLGLSKISVEDVRGEFLLDSFENIDDWYVSGKLIDTSGTTISIVSDNSTEGATAVKLNYRFDYSSGNFYYAYLNTDKPVYGIPESVTLDVFGNEFQHTMALIVSDENGEEFALIADKQISAEEAFNTYTMKFSNPIEQTPNAKFYYPVRIKQIAIVLGSGKVPGTSYKGELIFDNLRIQYPAEVGVKSNSTVPNEFKLFQNYPNPFNPSTSIEYSIPNVNHNMRFGESHYRTTLIVYDVLGREVATLVDKYQETGNYKVSFDGSNLASGIYFYKLTAGEYSASKKLLLLK